jgi:hypothetical protein
MSFPDKIRSGVTFGQEPVQVDGFYFKDCKFLQSKIIFRGFEPVQFDGCLFDRCEWVFDGPAENTLLFLSALHRGLGLEGANLVEGIFESIRIGGVEKGILVAEPAPLTR